MEKLVKISFLLLFIFMIGAVSAFDVDDEVAVNENSNSSVDTENGYEANLNNKINDYNSSINENDISQKKNISILKDENSNFFDDNQSKIIAKDLSMFYHDGTKFKVKVLACDDDILVNEKVLFTVNNKKISVKTDRYGYASIKITELPKTYTIIVQSAGVNITKNIIIKQILSLKNIKIKKSAKKIVLTAKLAKINGKYLKGKTIKFKFNNKLYKSKTNAKGIAKVSVKKSVIKKLKVNQRINYQATYIKDTVKKSVMVKK